MFVAGVDGCSAGWVSAYAIVEHPAFSNFGGGIGIKITGPTQSGNNANAVLGGGVVGTSDSGSIGIYVEGDSNVVVGTDFEDVDIGVDIAGHFNVLTNVRCEGIGTDYFKFESGADRNTITTITRASGVTVSDAGSNNSVVCPGTFIQQTSISNSGQVSYTFKEDANQTLNVNMLGGSTADQLVNLNWQDHTGTTKFTLQKDTSNNFYLFQTGETSPPWVAAANGSSGLNSNGTSAITFNSINGSGTGGVVFYSGGVSSTAVASIDGSGNASFNGTLASGAATLASATVTSGLTVTTGGLTVSAGGASITGTVAVTGGVTISTTLKVGSSIGFYGTTPISKPTVTGSKGSNAALGSLMTALSSLGLVTDSTS